MWNDVEWNMICRVCLQDGDMTSIYEADSTGKTIKEKILLCSPIRFEKGSNLPEQVCTVCLVDLTTAYRFYSNCESTEAVLKSIQENLSDPFSGDTDEKPCYVKEEPLTDDEVDEIDELNDPDEQQDEEPDEENVEFLDSIGYSDNSQSNGGLMEPVTTLTNDATDEFVINMLNDENQTSQSNKEEPEVKLEEQHEVQTIRPVRSNKFRNKKVATVEDITTHLDQNGMQTTVIRMRNIKEHHTPETNGKPPKVCEICGNTYKYRHALESHMRRHRGEKPFACSICDKAFVIAFELKRHMRTHTGQKPYQCKYCDRKFSDFGSRIKHERSHTGERPYQCSQCGKNFAYSHVLSSHMLTHTGEKKYHCDECGKRFTKGHHLKAHKNTHTRALMKSSSPKVHKPNNTQKIVTIHPNSIGNSRSPNSQEQAILNSMINKLEGIPSDSVIVISQDQVANMAAIKLELKSEDNDLMVGMDTDVNNSVVIDDIIEDDGGVEEDVLTEIHHRDVIMIE
nr:cucoid [Nephrotoma suturalis]